MKKQLAFALSFLLVFTVILSGCSGGSPATSQVESIAPSTSDATQAPDENGEDSAPETASADGKAACILGVGGLGDQSYNDLVYAGMQKAESDLGVAFDYAEPKQISDFELIMRDMASSGNYGVIVCVGFDQVDPLIKIAPEFPDQQFALIDGEVEAPNVVNYMCKEEEGSFLVGALAGLMKKNAAGYEIEDNGQIGFVAAMEIPLLVKFAAGYQAGAQYVNSDVTVFIDYVGGANPFSDTTTAKEIATSQNSRGADIVYHAAGGSGLGVFQAGKEGGFYAIGCNSNQNILEPDVVVASMLKRVDTAAFEIVKAAVVDNNLQVGDTVILGVSDDGVGYTLEGSNIQVSAEDVAVIEAIRQKIVSGEIVVPESLDEVEDFLASNPYEG